MGLLDIFRGNRSQPAPHVINIDNSLGNTLLAGSSKYGVEQIFTYFLNDAYNNGKKILVLRGGANNFSSLNTSFRARRDEVYSIDLSQGARVSNQLNLFDVYQGSEQIQQISETVAKYCGLEARIKTLISRYIETINKLRIGTVEIPKITDLVKFYIDRLDTLNARYSQTNSADGRSIQLYLDGLRHTDYFYIESAFSEIANSAVGKVLSGRKSLRDVFSEKDIVEITIDSTDIAGTDTFLYTVYKYLIKLNNSYDKYLIIIDGLTPEQYVDSDLTKLLSLSQLQISYSVQDIKGMTNKVGNQWLEQTSSILFFRQTSPENMAFAADKIGKYETVERERNGGSSHPKTIMGSLFGIYDRNKLQVQEGWHERKVEKYYFRPEEFGSLSEREAIVYISSTGIFSKLNL